MIDFGHPQPWSEFRDTFTLTVPTTTIGIEPEFGGTGSTITMLVPPPAWPAMLESLRGLVEELEGMVPKC